MERIAGRCINPPVLNGWVGSQTAWRLFRSPGAHYPAQPLGVPGWLQVAATPAHTGIARKGRWHCLITIWRWSRLFKGCFLNLTRWILRGAEIWLPFTVSFWLGNSSRILLRETPHSTWILCWVLGPSLQDTEVLECVPRRAVELMESLEHHSDEEQLREPGVWRKGDS